MAVGYDNIDVNKASQYGITVTNTPHVLTETTAELGFTLMLTVARRIIEAATYVQEGQWKAGDRIYFQAKMFMVQQLASLVWAILVRHSLIG